MGTNKMIPAQSLICFACEDLGSPEGCGKAPPSRPCADRDCCVQETESEGGSYGHQCRLSLSQPISLSMFSSHEGSHFPCSRVFLLDASPTLNSSFAQRKTATFAQMPLHLPFLPIREVSSHQVTEAEAAKLQGVGSDSASSGQEGLW